MIPATILKWLPAKWRPENVDPSLFEAYVVTFNTSLHGQRVLQHLLDTIYCQVYKGTDPNEALAFNARRSIVHEILVNIDKGQQPMKYVPQVVTQFQTGEPAHGTLG